MPAEQPIRGWPLRLAAHWLRLGGIVAYPTEAVFGLGCDPLNQAAVERLLRLKRREAQKGLILISDSFERLEPFLEPLPEPRKQEILASWPGPVTWLIPAKADVPDWLRGRHDTLAVRVTDHPLAAALCREAGTALVSTSANLSGRPPARNPLQVRLRCGASVDWVLHGETGGLQRPSRIIDARTGRVVRA